MKIVIFGTGIIFRKNYKELISEEIIAVVDNDIEKKGQIIGDYCISNPSEIINKSEYDYVVIAVGSALQEEIWIQLRNLGEKDEKVLSINEFLGIKHPNREIFPAGTNGIRKALIICNELGYHGVPIVSQRSALCLKELGYDVTIASPSGNRVFISEANHKGITVVIQKSLVYPSKKSLEWINQYEFVLVNSYVMILCALKIADNRRVVLWIHENNPDYKGLYFRRNMIDAYLKEYYDRIKIVAVSSIAEKNFRVIHDYNGIIETIPVAVEDWERRRIDRKKTEKVIAVIGGIERRKGQDVFLDSWEKVNENLKKSMIVYFIGKIPDNKYYSEIANRISKDDKVFFFNEVDQSKIKELYQEIDVVIVPSREETMSMAAIEAMMMDCNCIVSNKCGIADYIKHKENGMIFDIDNPDELTLLIEWCFFHNEELSNMKREGRKTYEQFFSMDNLKVNLKGLITEMSKEGLQNYE